ncbi:MAG: NAD-dependent epimerase/dehydratase family protein [Anaerolineaceae bacterium]|nr:NAD-dependent epimerase/dehydratase family protein [Anaerolineaceae bacterium]
MQHILVTGGNGFIGSHLVDALAAAGYHVMVLDLFPRTNEGMPEGVQFVQGSLQDLHTVRRLLEDHRIELVYHTAWANIHETALKDPLGDIQTNVAASLTLLTACRDTAVKRVVYLSSGGTIYGVPHEFPTREDHPTNPINAYGITKLMVEKYLNMFYHLYGLEYTILRPSVPYGPRQNPYRHQGVVSVFINRALRNEPVTVFGDGQIVRDYFYIDDLIKALLTTKDLTFTPSLTTFNVGGMRPYTLNDLIVEIESVLGVKMNVNYEQQRKFDVPYLLLDTKAAQSDLNWSPAVSLEEGIRRTAEWQEKWIDREQQ